MIKLEKHYSVKPIIIENGGKKVRQFNVSLPLNACVSIKGTSKFVTSPFRADEFLIVSTTRLFQELTNRLYLYPQDENNPIRIAFQQVAEVGEGDRLKPFLGKVFHFHSGRGAFEMNVEFVIDQPLTINNATYLQVYNYVDKTWLVAPDFGAYSAKNIIHPLEFPILILRQVLNRNIVEEEWQDSTLAEMMTDFAKREGRAI